MPSIRQAGNLARGWHGGLINQISVLQDQRQSPDAMRALSTVSRDTRRAGEDPVSRSQRHGQIVDYIAIDSTRRWFNTLAIDDCNWRLSPLLSGVVVKKTGLAARGPRPVPANEDEDVHRSPLPYANSSTLSDSPLPLPLLPLNHHL
jgi:hypothetical protein